MFDCVVIGKGLVGAAAFRYLSEARIKTAVVGPGEPVNYMTHNGVYSSHYDEGRHVYQLGKDPISAALTAAAIEQLLALEQRTGISFFIKCGRLIIVREQDRLPAAKDYSLPGGLSPQLFSPVELVRQFPFLRVPETCIGVYEPPPAGVIRPRALLGAQLAVGARQGGTIIRQEVRMIALRRGGVVVTTADGVVLRTRNVLIATGAFANCYELLLRPLSMRIKTESTILVEVSTGVSEHLYEMPTLHVTIASREVSGIYVTPPTTFPDGQTYLKVGGNTAEDRNLRTLEDMQCWMREGPSPLCSARLFGEVTTMIPRLPGGTYVPKPCLVAYTSHGRAYIDQVDDGVFVAVGGNGVSAQTSDTLGWLAAKLVIGAPWPIPFRREAFRAIYE